MNLKIHNLPTQYVLSIVGFGIFVSILSVDFGMNLGAVGPATRPRARPATACCGTARRQSHIPLLPPPLLSTQQAPEADKRPPSEPPFSVLRRVQAVIFFILDMFCISFPGRTSNHIRTATLACEGRLGVHCAWVRSVLKGMIHRSFGSLGVVVFFFVDPF